MKQLILLSMILYSSCMFAQNPAWTRINPFPTGSNISDLQKIPGTNRLIAACSNSTILISDNAGETWQTILYPGNMPNDFDPVGFYFLNDHVGFLYGSLYSILKTTDAGLTWELCYSHPNLGYSTYIFDIDFISESVGFAIGENKQLLKTIDHGETWIAFDPGFEFDFEEGSCIEFVNEEKGFITPSDQDSLMMTTDGGNTWNLLPHPMGLNPSYYNVYQFKFINNLVGFASLYNIIYKTTDGGLNWYQVYQDSQGIFQCRFEFYDENNGIAFMRPGSRLLVTSDGGESWQVVEQSEEEICCHDVAYYNQNILFAGGDGGCVYKSGNGGIDWQKASHNSLQGMFMNFFVFNTNTAIMNELSEDQNYIHIIKTTDGFSTFDTLITLRNNWVGLDFPDSETGFYANCTSGYLILYRTFNGGNNWIRDTIAQGLPLSVRKIDFYDRNKGIIVFLDRLFLTVDGGETWQEKFIPESTALRNVCYTTNSKIVLNAEYQSNPALFISDDNGETWTVTNTNLPEYARPYFIDGMTGFLLAERNIYKTIDGGYNFTKSSIEGDAQWYFWDMTFTSIDTGYAVGVSDYGTVLNTTDSGNTWNKTQSPTAVVLMDVDFLDNETGYVTNGTEIYKTTSGGILGIEKQPLIQQIFSAYPNPFKSGILINVTDKECISSYMMDVIDIHGKILYSASIQPQSSSIWFQGSMLSPGVYFLQFKTGNKVIETIKVIKI